MNFKTMCEAIEENNRINDGKWSDWESVKHMENIYGELSIENLGFTTDCLINLINNEGRNLDVYLEAFRALEYGIN